MFDIDSTLIVVDGPIVTDDDEVTTAEDTATPVDLWGNDVWAGSTAPGLSILSGPAHGDLTVDPQTAEVTYDPDPEFHGTDAFTYELDDGNGNTDTAMVAITERCP